jgi:hypothetical protein
MVFLGSLGLVIGSIARSERGVVALSFLFGLLYGGVEVLVIATALGWPSPARALVLLGLGLVLALPVYAIAEIWRRTHTRLRTWLWRR